MPSSQTVRLGRLQVVLDRRQLLADGIPVPLGARAFEILELLMNASGRLVTKAEIMRHVWPTAPVAENTFHVQISALRKALGPDGPLLKTVSGRGYQLMTGTLSNPVALSPIPALPPSNLPLTSSPLIGRDPALTQLQALVATNRIVTLTGAGGIGKTRLAIDLAWRLLPGFADGVWLVDLAPLSHQDLVLGAVTSALGLGFAGGVVSPERIAQSLASKQLLLVLDNCEHVIDIAARLAEAMVRVNPQIRVLTTSREPLAAHGEWVFLVPPLDVPDQAAGDSGALLQSGAVQLFVARAQAADSRFTPNPGSVAVAAEICRRIDGIPLAIEFAAARVATFGLDGVNSRLSDRFALLTAGRRTALPRQRTLRATLDWSYDMLVDGERSVLRRLAVFAGVFTLEAAIAVAGSAEFSPAAVGDHISNLVAKSLITSEIRGTDIYYRLLETTRVYIKEKLLETAELGQVCRRHGLYYRELCGRMEAQSTHVPAAEWLDSYGPQLDNMRAALDWAFAPGGDPAIGIGITIACLSLWKLLSLMDECRHRVARALSAIGAAPEHSARQEMQLRATLGTSSFYMDGPGPAMDAAWTTVLDLASQLEEVDYALRALFGLWLGHLHRGEMRASLAVAERFTTTAMDADDPLDHVVGHRMISTSHHYLGDQSAARRHLDQVLTYDPAAYHWSHIVRFNFNQPMAARAFLARILLLQGLPDQAKEAARRAVEAAQTNGHDLSLCHALAQAACPVALFTGDLAAAEAFVTTLIARATQHGLVLWRAIGHCYKGALVIQQGDTAAGCQMLRQAMAGLGPARFAAYQAAFLGNLAQGLAANGQIGEARAVIDDALARCERFQTQWCLAELLRTKGELILLHEGEAATATAERHFQEALVLSRQQGALSFELRAAMSLGRLWLRQGRPDEARAAVAHVHQRFTEGFATADLQAAQEFLVH